MSNHLQPYNGTNDNLSSRSGALSRRSPAANRIVRAIEQNVVEAHGHGIVNAAKVRAVEHVASEALLATASLADQEAFLTQQVPHAAGRLQAIADLATMAMGDILIEMRRG